MTVADTGNAPPTLAETRTGYDWCPSCRVEAGTDRYADDNGIERCAVCGAALVHLRNAVASVLIANGLGHYNRAPGQNELVHAFALADKLIAAGLVTGPRDRAARVARVNEALRAFLDWLDEDKANLIDFEYHYPELWRRFLAATAALLARTAEQVPAATQPVTAEQVEQVTAHVYDEIEADFFSDLPDEARGQWLRLFTSAFRRAGIPVDGGDRG